jgi:hypothetical protein
MVLWPLERRIRSGSSILSIHHPQLKYTVLARGRTTTNKRSKRTPAFRAPHLPVFLILVGAVLEISEPKLNIHIAPSLFTKIVQIRHLVAVVVSEVAMLPVCQIIHSQPSDYSRPRHSHEFGDSLDGVRNQVLEKRGHNFLFERRQCLDDLSINLVVLLPHL